MSIYISKIVANIVLVKVEIVVHIYPLVEIILMVKGEVTDEITSHVVLVEEIVSLDCNYHWCIQRAC